MPDLVEDHLPVAYAAAARWRKRVPRGDHDFLGVACLGLCQAAASFDPGRRVRFTTFARRRIEFAILDHLRDHGRRPRARQLRAADLAAAHRDFAAVEARHDAAALLARVPAADRAVCLAVTDGATLAAAGAAAGISKTTAWRRYRDSIELMRSARPEKVTA